MDALLARTRMLPVYVAAAVCFGAAGRVDAEAAKEALGIAGAVLFIFAVRAFALSNGRPAERWKPWPLTAVRVVAALGAGVAVWLGDRDAYAAALAIAAALAYAIRPLPDWLPARTASRG